MFITRIVAAVLVVVTVPFVAAAQSAGNETATIEAWLKGYDTAFLSKDLNKIAAFYHPDVTIYEGAGVNNGWSDYRDRHWVRN